MDSTTAAELTLSQDIDKPLFVREDLNDLIDYESTSDSERSSVERTLFQGSKFKYVLGNESSGKASYTREGKLKEPSGKEIPAGDYTLKLVTNQSDGRELNKNIFTSSARGPVVLTIPILYNGDYRYFTIKVVPTSGELYEIVAPSDVMRLNYPGEEVNMGAPRQKETNVSNIALKRTRAGLNVKIQYEVNDVILVRGGEAEHEETHTDYELHFKGDEMFVRKVSDNEDEPLVNVLNLEGPWIFTIDNSSLLVDSGQIMFCNIERTGKFMDIEESLSNSPELKPPIEGYTLRMFLFNDEVHVVTYTRLDDASRYANVKPVEIFKNIMSKNGIELRSFFPKGCKTSPITYFFHVGTNNLVMNSRLNYLELDTYVMFAFALNAWSYDTVEHQVLERIYGDLGTRHDMLQNQLEMIPPQFKECTYAHNIKWPELCYQGPGLRIDAIHALTNGVIGDEVSAPSKYGSREETDPRLFPGEAVVAVINNSSNSNDRIHPIKFMSPSYDWRAQVRGGKDWPFQAWFNLARRRDLQILISRTLFNSLKRSYEENRPVEILPHYDSDADRMTWTEVKSNFAEYITVLWLYSLPTHAQATELRERNGFMGIIKEINDGIEKLAQDLANVTLITNEYHLEFLNRINGAIAAIQKSDNERNGTKRIRSLKPSHSMVIRALIGKNDKLSPNFNLFRKFYFSSITNQLPNGVIPNVEITDESIPIVRKSRQSRNQNRRKGTNPKKGRGIKINTKPTLQKGDMIDFVE